MKKYVVTIKYYDFIFDDADEAFDFVKIAVNHMSNDISVSIKLLTNDENKED